MFRSLLTFAIFLVLIPSCDKAKTPELLCGEWKKVAQFTSEGWKEIPDSSNVIVQFNQSGFYSEFVNGKVNCSGSYQVDKDKNLIINRNGCLPMFSSTETIFTLTQDTLIVSDHSSSISSFSGTMNKYKRH